MDADYAVQYILKSSGADLKADGKIGPKTKAALSAAPTAVQETIAKFRSLPVVKPIKVRARKESRLFISNEEAATLVTAISRELKVPASYLSSILKWENYTVPGGYETTMSGTYRGLGQFSRLTWSDYESKVGPYDSMTHEKSLRATALYYLANRRTYRSQGHVAPFTNDMAYLYHNQGPGGGDSYLRTGTVMAPGQSPTALRVLKQARVSYVQDTIIS